MNSNLIINADDFGLSDTVNKAIIHCLKNGIINSTSLMTNTPGFSDAVELANENRYTDCIGVHVNLTEGKPLTNFRHAKYLNEDGSWNQYAYSAGKIWLNRQVREDFSREIIAQINKVEKTGIIPSHINSHHHIHTFPSLLFLFLNICRSRKYKLRIAQTQFEGKYIKAAYRSYINSVIRKNGLHFSDYLAFLSSSQAANRMAYEK